MRLCLIAPAPPPFGGVANWQQIMVDEIKKRNDISLHFINIAANKRPTDGRNIFDRIFFSSYVMFRAYFQLKKLVKHNPPDIVHMATSGGLGFFRDLLILRYLKKQSIPSVYHIHFGRSAQYRAEKGRCWKQLMKAISIADTTIAIDRDSYDILKPIAKKVELVNNPIQTSKYDKYEKTETNTILYLGWIIKAKGIEELLLAFSIFNEKHNGQYCLELVGPGLDKYVSELKNNYPITGVKIVGEVSHEEAMKKLSKARILVLPSYTEGFPNVILEAMAMGKCIVATDVGAIPEMLQDNAGILIKPKNIDNIVAALELSEDDDIRRKYGEDARRRVMQEYDIGCTFKKYKKIWGSCLE